MMTYRSISRIKTALTNENYNENYIIYFCTANVCEITVIEMKTFNSTFLCGVVSLVTVFNVWKREVLVLLLSVGHQKTESRVRSPWL